MTNTWHGCIKTAINTCPTEYHNLQILCKQRNYISIIFNGRSFVTHYLPAEKSCTRQFGLINCDTWAMGHVKPLTILTTEKAEDFTVQVLNSLHFTFKRWYIPSLLGQPLFSWSYNAPLCDFCTKYSRTMVSDVCLNFPRADGSHTAENP